MITAPTLTGSDIFVTFAWHGWFCFAHERANNVD